MDIYIVGEIKSFSGTRIPSGWLPCDGATLKIKEHETLFSIIGTLYGGDGTTTFCVPDLRGRIPLGSSTAYPVGHKGGSESVKLTVEQLPAHNHIPSCNTATVATNPDALGSVWASVNKVGFGYSNPPGSLHLNAESIGMEGGDEAHENRMPFIAITYLICENGIYPFRA